MMQTSILNVEKRLMQFSATKISTYEQCKNWFLARYVYHYPDVQNTWAILGKGIHKALEQYFSIGANVYDTFQLYVQVELQRLGSTALAGVHHSQIMPLGFGILDTFDYSLYTALHTELPIEVYIKRYKITGIIDLVTHDHEIVDFKTAASVPSQAKVDNSIQLALYYHAYREIYKQEPLAVKLHHVRTGKVFTASKTALESRIQALPDVLDDMDALIKNPPKAIKKCKKCFVLCPLYKSV